MRLPARLGAVLFMLGVAAGQQAISDTRGRYYRLPDPDLIALAKFGEQARKAMESFVLRPRVPDSYDLVCSSCMHKKQKEFLPPVADVASSVRSRTDATASVEAPRRRKLRYVSFSWIEHRRRAPQIGQRFLIEGRRVRRNGRLTSIPDATAAWEAELRR